LGNLDFQGGSSYGEEEIYKEKGQEESQEAKKIGLQIVQK
jgi:hypothetical protein